MELLLQTTTKLEATLSTMKRPLFEFSPAHPDLTTSQPMAREHGSGQGQPRQAGCGRRNSPASPNAENMLDPSVATDQVETTPEDDSIERLTARLDTLRREQSELDKQVLEEEVDFKHSIANLTIERDQLKQTSKEREEASIELKKQANLTHKRQKSALSKKAQKERLLNEKKAEKQKTKEEILRWKQEIVEMRQDVEDMSREQADVLSSKDQVIADVRTAMAEDQAVIRSLEEEIRATGSKIKAMQEHREKISDSLEEDLVLAAQERQGDREWEAHVQSLDVYIRSLITTLRQVSDFFNTLAMTVVEF